LVIEAVDTRKSVESVGSHHADPRSGRFDYGITIGADHRRNDYAAEAVLLLLRLMFAERRYHRCQTWAFAQNEASPVLHRRLGFIEEGGLRDHVFFAGRHHDLGMMRMPAGEFALMATPGCRLEGHSDRER
jgi:RimJ/RimL family protein N-acetyltransferase